MIRKVHYLMFVFILFSVCQLSGQRLASSAVTGRVTGIDGQPLAGASVVVETLKTGVATDNNGRYSLRGLRDGTYALRITFTGYEPFDTVVVVNGSTVADAVLKEALYVAGEVIVRGSRAGSRTPMAYTNVDASELRERLIRRIVKAGEIAPTIEPAPLI